MDNKNGKSAPGSRKMPVGKPGAEFLRSLFNTFNRILEDSAGTAAAERLTEPRARTVIGYGIGEDAAVIDMGDKYLVAKTDPITFTTDEIGYYAVAINSNDIVCRGAVPKWFLVTVLLPENKTTPEYAEKICTDIFRVCISFGIMPIGGHTEITYGLDRPIVVGCMLGEVDKENLVKVSGGRPGDDLIVTKGIPLEGTSIIAREMEDKLIEFGIAREVIERAKNYLHEPGISVMKEALLVAERFDIHAMHDPTEGGLAMGVVELASASGCGAELYIDRLPVLPEGKIFCEYFGLDVLGVIASGSLLIAADPSDTPEIINLLKKHGIAAAKIGRLTEDSGFYGIDGNGKHPLKYSQIDEITKIF